MLHHKNPFQMSGSSDQPTLTGQVAKEKDSNLPITDRIKNLLAQYKVLLFMKGTPDFPQCGFSANVANILNRSGISYHAFDILSDQDMRQAVKEYANWPTYPQLWVNGELIGGSDIVTELAQNGELTKTIGLI